MKILVVTQYFMPETFIINELVLEIEKLGNQVTVLTGKPNYPDGHIFPGFKAGGVQREVFGKDIDVVRVPLRPRGVGGAFNLILNYLSFAFSGSIFGSWILRKKSFDVIFVFGTSPITAAIPAIVINFFKRSALSLWVQDLWPESLVVTKFVKNKLILKLVEALVWWIYRCCDVVLVQSKSFIRPISLLSKRTKVIYYPNSFKSMEYGNEKALPPFLDQLLDNNFCVVFAGNIGKAQSVETIVGAAQILKDVERLKIVFVGSGSMLSWIEDQKALLDLDNIECVGRYDISYIPAIYVKSKALLLTLNSDEILQYTLPWKTQSYMASGRPIVGAIDGEGARVISEASCGLVGAAENAKTLAENIRAIHSLGQIKLDEMGNNGRRYFAENFEMISQTKKLLSLFAELASKSEKA